MRFSHKDSIHPIVGQRVNVVAKRDRIKAFQPKRTWIVRRILYVEKGLRQNSPRERYYCPEVDWMAKLYTTSLPLSSLAFRRKSQTKALKTGFVVSCWLFQAAVIDFFGLTFLLLHKPIVDVLLASMRFLRYFPVCSALRIWSIVVFIFDFVHKYPPWCPEDPYHSTYRHINTLHTKKSYWNHQHHFLPHKKLQSTKMCFVNQSICSGCKTVTETPAPKQPCARTPDVLQHGCPGQKVVVAVEHTGPEFCLNCYNNELLNIRKKWEKIEAVFRKEAKKRGYTPSQADSQSASVKQAMSSEIMRLDQKWEKMWCA